MSGNMNQEMSNAISQAADPLPFKSQVDGSNSHSSASDVSIDLNISTPCFTSDSNISSTTVGSAGSSQSSMNSRKRGLGMILSSDEEADPHKAAPRLWRTKSLLFRNDVRPVPSVPNNVVKPMVFSVTRLVQVPQYESHGVSPRQQVSDTVYGPRQDPFTQRIVRIIWPCILASEKLNLALDTGDSGYAPSSIPVAICTKHGNMGFLKLEEIEHTEGYTLIIHHHPDPRVVHMYNQCVLIFPPSAPNYFHEKNDQLSPPFKLDSCTGTKTQADTKNKFLKNCQTCDKSLEGEDIYIYRGDSSFCSEECREVEIEADKKKKLMKEAAKSSTKSAAPAGKKSIFFIEGDEPIGV